MTKFLFFVSSLLLLTLSCVNAPEAKEPMATVDLGDPLYVQGAPKMISFKETAVANQPPPGAYPQDAVNRGIHGDILVEVWISPSGVPTKSAVLWGPKELHGKAAAYVLEWRFKPYLLNGVPIPARFRMLMPFRLNNGGIYQRLPKGLVY